jgi:hypothetical protein
MWRVFFFLASKSVDNSHMTFSGLNIVGVLIAFVISFISGGIWFGPKTFYPIWMKARGIQSGQLDHNQNKPALTLALIITSLQKHNTNIGISDGAGIGFALGVGIGMFASLSHRLFGGDGLKVWIIETANDAINLTIAGAIIAYFN